MRRFPVLVAGLLALALPPQAAHADLPIAYVGPTYFTDADKGGPSWKAIATGSQLPVDSITYGVDPDVQIVAPFGFSDANNAQGTISPGISYWPRGWTPLPVSQGSRAVMGYSPAFMVAVQRRFPVDDFVVFVLDLTAEDRLAGDYYTCGPAAFQPNPPTLGNNGAPGYYDGPFYGEGAIVLERGATTPAAPPAPVELYGYFGSIGGESPFCDEVRANPAFWNSQPAPPTPANDTRRTTLTEAACNRGPNPGDPFSCTATVGDSDQRLGATAPIGIVGLTATSGALSTPTCSLIASPSSPATATCSFTYANPSVGAGNSIPVTARYQGSGAHKPSSGSVAQAVPDMVPEDPGLVVCGAPPLPACQGLVPQPGPVETCVGNVGGACENPRTQLAPIKVCIANTVKACEGFTGGAVFAGEIEKEFPEPPATIVCPEVDLVDPTPEYEACRAQFTLTTEEAAAIKEYDAVFKQEIRLRYAVEQAVNARGDNVKKHLARFTVADVANLSLQRSINSHNAKVRTANMVIDALKDKQQKRANVAHLHHLDLLTRLSTFKVYGLGPDGQFYYDPRVTSLKINLDRAAGAKKRTFVKALAPSRKGQVFGQWTIASSPTVTIAAGTQLNVLAKFNKLGRALLRRARARGRRTVALRATVTMTSTGGRFAPTTVSRSLRAKLPKKKPAKPKK